MSNTPESAVQPATYILPDGFTVQDLAAPDYVRPLAEAAAPMIEHCQRLLVAIARPDFDGGLELDCTKNNAMTWLDDFFETVARYEEGRVPFAAAAELLALTERLLAAEMRRYPRLRGDIQSIGQAFRRSFALWGRVLPQPRRSRKIYLRKIFASFDKIIDAICTFNSRLF
ncbi:MAG: hypothetical protein MJ240_10225, partial [Kiritimatiellae bacterium]|nr:hypothetical protein [Kiritimatiellia bacterium]